MTLRDLFDENGNDQNNIDDGVDEQNLLTDGGEGEVETIPQQMQEDGMTNYPQGSSDPAHDFKYVDRFVKVRGLPQPAKNSKEESAFILNNDFAEQLILNFFSDKDQRHIWRSLADIMDQAEGEGNSKVALQDARLLAARILMKRSSTENTLALNERTAHIEQRSRQSIVSKSNTLQSPSNGSWLSRLFGR